MAKRIVLTGGGTGGHLFPLVTVAEKIREIKGDNKVEFLFMGPVGELEKEIMEANMISQKNILCGKLRRYASMQYLIDLLKMPIGFIQAMWNLLWYMPDAVFAKGGFASVPVVMAARIYRIPVLIHESDAIPGLANKFLGSIVNRIAITFERARMYFPNERTITTGNPVRADALGGDREKGREALGLQKEFKPVIFFVGGSQGARVINDRVLEYLDDLLKKYQIVHQTGKAHYNRAVREAQKKGYKIEHSDYFPIAFLKDEIKHVLALADVVVSRAGSTAISELAANKKASILVPIKESANDHQRINAFEVSKAGGAIVLEEDNLKKNILMHKIEDLIGDSKLREKVEEGISKFHNPQATKQIAEEVLALWKK